MKTNHRILPFVLSGLMLTVVSVLPAMAQTHNENVDVIAPYQPVISDAFKINVNPVIADTVREKPKIKYEWLNPGVQTTYAVDPLKPAKIGNSTVPKLYRFLLKAGFGNYTTPYGEFFYQNRQSKTYALGVHIKHLSSYGKLKDYGYPGFSDNQAEFYGRKMFKKHVFSGNLGYDRNVIHYYGYKPDDFLAPPSKDDIKQRFSLFRADVHLNSLENPDSLKLNHSVDLGFYNLTDRYGTNETNILLGADVNKELRLVKITKSQVIGINGKVDYTFFQDSLKKHNYGLISLVPYLRTKFRAFTFNIGLDVTLETDATTRFHFYPIADVQFNIVRDILILYGGIKGQARKNSYRSLTAENPFVTGMAEMKPTLEQIELFAGIRSNISRELSAHAWANYIVAKDVQFFVLDTNAVFNNIFTTLYDDANIFRIRGEFAWQKAETVYLRVGGDFWNYDMKNEIKAWQKPYFDLFLNFKYNWASKIIVRADLYAYSDRWAKRYTANTVAPEKLKAYVDGNIGLEYNFSKILSVFLNVNNIGSSRYKQWHNYPSYGINLIGGITYSL